MSEVRGRQVEAMEGKRKLWKRSRSHGRGAEAVEEDRKSWKRVEEAGQGLESNGTLHQLAVLSKIEIFTL